MTKKSQKKLKPNFYNFEYGKLSCSLNDTNQPKSTVELGYMCPRGLTGPPVVTLTTNAT